jgi:hypothetical protein
MLTAYPIIVACQLNISSWLVGPTSGESMICVSEVWSEKAEGVSWNGWKHGGEGPKDVFFTALPALHDVGGSFNRSLNSCERE